MVNEIDDGVEEVVMGGLVLDIEGMEMDGYGKVVLIRFRVVKDIVDGGKE